MKLWFHPYKERPNPNPHTTWVSVLMQTASGLRDGLEINSIGPPTWFGRPCCPPKVVVKLEDVLHHS
jgi:hypothetical protein